MVPLKFGTALESDDDQVVGVEIDDTMRCLSCPKDYASHDTGTCKECYEDLKSKANRSPVFRAMLENQMEEGLGGTIKISDVSHDALHAFVNYLYTAEACLDDQMARDLLVMAEKYQVKHLKVYCEKFILSKLNGGNSLSSYAFAHQHNAKHLLDAALLLIVDNMDKLTKLEEYKELKEKDPQLVLEIYEAYLAKQVEAAALEEKKKNQFKYGHRCPERKYDDEGDLFSCAILPLTTLVPT
ncbi:BTB/POZ domain [Dillenia turbinata]|uniref:BTB/POZ domain n=1 Tax=Dillenia turbinata TaxID=194707 RepID=A0AAN8ZGA6_9MAGN